ncbi:glycosyl transferase family protein [Novosphingobium album (ex Hu et al. 2023)]|uniref:Glycosyl transferase family protein n=1 Tax=Novosphingobium album (ex Hu et al. 2023) TaxID=2930093 RepID=A0ABT0AXH9_9SPHN|nr:glycosyl transferase family protein [Novosphingobium album (ex Hu et al. 2023)]MCJ2177269.1 glycosyl transferase family protein [Novosphingobium album (ex Hu et al. 2023)]
MVGATDAIQIAIAAAQCIEQELLLFAGFWFLLGAIDDIGVDICWIWLKLTGQARVRTISRDEAARPLQGRAAILIAAWQEAEVIGHTVRHALSVWRQDDFTLYVGCYSNDPGTVAAAMSGAGGDARVRIVIHENAGPTTKADCLNRLYTALCDDERRCGYRFRSVVLHDSEDMVHPAELAVIDAGLTAADFVQLPVRPEPQPASPWVAGHYSDEFTESHAKVLVVRDALGAAIPAAGVACGFSRDIMDGIARRRKAEGSPGPFAAECLTEDYELGVLVWREGGTSRFLRVRDAEGGLVATRAYFPARLDDAVRQKARWVHGIAFQGWDRLGWGKGIADLWMVVRDRRGPLATLVLTCGYALVVIEGLLGLAWLMGARRAMAIPPLLHVMLVLCLAGLAWRLVARFAFTAHEYGVTEGLLAVVRVPVANFIAILAGRKAFASYLRTLRGAAVRWDKTEHAAHPVTAATGRASSL